VTKFRDKVRLIQQIGIANYLAAKMFQWIFSHFNFLDNSKKDIFQLNKNSFFLSLTHSFHYRIVETEKNINGIIKAFITGVNLIKLFWTRLPRSFCKLDHFRLMRI
jgi:hypothetical protein